MLTTKKNFLVLGEGFTQRLDDTILSAEKKYSIKFTEHNKGLCLSLYDNEANIYLFLMALKFINLKQKTLKIMQFCYV